MDKKSARYLANGAQALIEFLGPEQEPVALEIATRRAAICLGSEERKPCPLNLPAKGWKKTISKLALKATRAYFHIKDALELRVEGEEKLGICDACWCPLKLKIWMPIKHIIDHTPEEVLADLHKDCWIRSEME